MSRLLLDLVKGNITPAEVDELNKAKYHRRWKGPDGKWRYEYKKPGGERRAKQQQSPAWGKLATMADEHPDEVQRVQDWVLDVLERRPLKPRSKVSEAMTYGELLSKINQQGGKVHPHDLEHVLDRVMARDSNLRSAGFRTRGSGSNQRYFMLEKGA